MSGGLAARGMARSRAAGRRQVRRIIAERAAKATPVCRWLISLAGQAECGKPATHVRRGCGLTYCTAHAERIAPYLPLELLAP